MERYCRRNVIPVYLQIIDGFTRIKYHYQNLKSLYRFYFNYWIVSFSIFNLRFEWIAWKLVRLPPTFPLMKHLFYRFLSFVVNLS